MGFVNSQMLAGAAGGIGRGVSDMALLKMRSMADAESGEANFRKERSLKQMDIDSAERIAGAKPQKIETITNDDGSESSVIWDKGKGMYVPFQMGGGAGDNALTEEELNMARVQLNTEGGGDKANDWRPFNEPSDNEVSARAYQNRGGEAPAIGGAPSGATKDAYYRDVVAANGGKDSPELKAWADQQWTAKYGETPTGARHAGQPAPSIKAPPGIVGGAAAAKTGEIPAYPSPPGGYKSSVPSIEGEQRIPTTATAAPEPSKEGITVVTDEMEKQRKTEADRKKKIAAKKRAAGVTVITPEIEVQRAAEKKALAERKAASKKRKADKTRRVRNQKAADARAGGTPSVRAVKAIRANDMSAMGAILQNPDDVARLTEHQRFTLEQAFFGTTGK